MLRDIEKKTGLGRHTDGDLGGAAVERREHHVGRRLAEVQLLQGQIVMACVVMACIVMACMIMAYVVMAYIVIWPMQVWCT